MARVLSPGRDIHAASGHHGIELASELEARVTEQVTTCGQGLASHAPFAKTIGEAAVALADLLAAHVPSLDPGDASGRAERDAYLSLERQYRQLAAACGSLAREMAGYRDLPQAEHDVRALQAQQGPFNSYVAAERRLRDSLNESLLAHEAMLTDADR